MYTEVKHLNSRIVLALAFFLCFSSNHAQIPDLKATRIQAEINGQNYLCYASNFDFQEKEVTRAFWKYSKSYGSLTNYRSHAVLTISPSVNDGNVAVLIPLKIETTPTGSTVYLAVEKGNMPDDIFENYQKETKNLLLNFKRQFYLDQMDLQIDATAKQAARKSKQYEKAKKKAKEPEKVAGLLDDLVKINESLLSLQNNKLSIANLK